jgi:hypothetical protein
VEGDDEIPDAHDPHDGGDDDGALALAATEAKEDRGDHQDGDHQARPADDPFAPLAPEQECPAKGIALPADGRRVIP